MENLEIILLALIPTVLSGVILANIKRSQKKAEQLEKDRQKRDLLILESIDANYSVTKELVECVLYNKEPNGELKEAYDYRQNVKHKLQEYEREQVSKL